MRDDSQNCFYCRKSEDEDFVMWNFIRETFTPLPQNARARTRTHAQST